MIIQREAWVPFSNEQMFSLVNEIEKYPEFLPWCHAAHVLDMTENVIEATLEIAWSGIHKSFTTRNVLAVGQTIHMHLMNGPFRHLAGVWSFVSSPSRGCHVALKLEFEVLNHWTGRLFQPIFHRIADSLVEAFCQRAKTLYEK